MSDAGSVGARALRETRRARAKRDVFGRSDLRDDHYPGELWITGTSSARLGHLISRVSRGRRGFPTPGNLRGFARAPFARRV